MAAVCGTCHVMMEDLYKKSPHQPVFAAMGAGGCVVCHSNHEIRTERRHARGTRRGVRQCHDATSAGGLAAAQMAGLLTR